MKLCSVDGCERKSRSRGFCTKHYQRWKNNGDPLVVQKRMGLSPDAKEKICSRCNENKDINMFNNDKNNSDGKHSYCKECQNEMKADYRKRNKEKISEYRKKHYQENREQQISEAVKWAKENRDRLNERRREWYEVNKEKALAYSRDYYVKNADKLREYKRKTYIKHKEKIKLSNESWKINNSTKMKVYKFNWRARKNKAYGSLIDEDWINILEYFNHSCAYCLDSTVALTIDHIIPFSKGGTHTVDNVVPACQPCNSKKNDKSLLEFIKEV